MNNLKYATAQICLNGHVIASACDEYTVDRIKKSSHCPLCGAATITECPKCKQHIRGTMISPIEYRGIETLFGINAEPYHPPAYCADCGSPFPWTKSKLDSIELIILEEEMLNDKNYIIEILPDVISETPKTQLAGFRIAKILESVSKITADELIRFIVQNGCAAIKEQLRSLIG